MGKYKKYEYCKSIMCPDLQSCAAIYFCDNKKNYCRRTAQEFYHWLKENGFEIIKHEPVCKGSGETERGIG